MDWIQVIAGSATIIGSIVAFGWYFLVRLEKDIDKIEKRLENHMKISDARFAASDARFAAFERRMDGHTARIDQLYGMFVQLLQREKT